MRIFLTGGTGFIGRHVTKELLWRGHTLLLLVRKSHRANGPPHARIRFLRGDLGKPESYERAIMRFRPDAAAHLAWEGIPDYGASVSLRNARQSIALFDALGRAGCRHVVATGSCWEYVPTPGKRREDDPVRHHNPFVAAKALVREAGEAIARASGTHFTWLRPFFVYGPGQKGHSLIPHLIASAQSGAPPALKDPCASNDFVYVGDVARAISAVLRIGGTPGTSVTYNVGSGRLTAVADITALVYKRFASQLGSTITCARADVERSFFADNRKIHRATGWSPRVSLREGLREVFRNSSEP